MPATEVGRRAGHRVAVVLKIYTRHIDGQTDAANKRIINALATPDAKAGPSDEVDDDSKPTTSKTGARPA